MSFVRRSRRGFTLVELLVVIGIIAVLIGILLPALSAARRAAAQTKCAAALREIGRATMMYSIDNRGYVPPAQIQNTIYKHVWGDTSPTYWPAFLQRYVTKTKVGSALSQDIEQSKKSVFWGCPAWDAVTVGAIQAQVGYGWNAFGDYTESFPGKNQSFGIGGTGLAGDYASFIQFGGFPPNAGAKFAAGKWFKLTSYQRHGAERMLAADGPFWLMAAGYPKTDGADNPMWVGQQNTKNNNVTYSASDSANQTLADWYRHGKYPGIDPAADDKFKVEGGKIAYNILYVDGHVLQSNRREDTYRSIRMRFPG